MTSLKQMDRAELQMFYEAALKEYESCKAKGLKLDMSRGKPSRPRWLSQTICLISTLYPTLLQTA